MRAFAHTFREAAPNGGFGVWWLCPPNPALAGNACRWAAGRVKSEGWRRKNGSFPAQRGRCPCEVIAVHRPPCAEQRALLNLCRIVARNDAHSLPGCKARSYSQQANLFLKGYTLPASRSGCDSAVLGQVGLPAVSRIRVKKVHAQKQPNTACTGQVRAFAHTFGIQPQRRIRRLVALSAKSRPCR